jgi:hypothetical protein
MQQVLNQSLSNTPRTTTATPSSAAQSVASRPPQSPVALTSQLSNQPPNSSNLTDEQLASSIEQMHALG